MHLRIYQSALAALALATTIAVQACDNNRAKGASDSIAATVTDGVASLGYSTLSVNDSEGAPLFHSEQNAAIASGYSNPPGTSGTAEYLVAFQTPSLSPNTGSGTDVFGKFINSNAVSGRGGSIPIATSAGNQIDPDIAFCAGATGIPRSYMVAWYNSATGSNGVEARVIYPTGATDPVTGSPDPNVGQKMGPVHKIAVGSGSYPSLAFDRNQNKYLVAYVDGVHVYSQMFTTDSNGVITTSPAQQLDTIDTSVDPGGSARRPQAVYIDATATADRRFVVTWGEDYSGSTPLYEGTHSASISGSTGAVIQRNGRIAAQVSDWSDLAYDKTNNKAVYLVRSGNPVYAYVLNADGALDTSAFKDQDFDHVMDSGEGQPFLLNPLPVNYEFVTTNPSTHPKLAYDTTLSRFMAVWTENIRLKQTTSNESDIHGLTFKRETTGEYTFGSPLVIADDASDRPVADQYHPAVGYSNGSFYAIWADLRLTSSPMLFGRLYN